jgi:succinate dehydrogenase/fumarate reductase flavoprotein subunit
MDQQVQQNQLEINRRDFMKTAGIGAAALSMGAAGMMFNANPVAAATLSHDTIDTDILVIGGGMAGTFAALKAKEQGLNVLLVDKGEVGKSGLSPFWQGVSIYEPEWATKYGLTEEKFLKEVAKATEYLPHQDYAKLWLKNSKQGYEDMVKIGIFGAPDNMRGAAMRKALVKNEVRLQERTMITSLLTKKGQVVGAVGFPLDSENAVVINAKAVIICAGSGTFKTPGWPGHSLTHDGDAMAYRVGAEITGKEWVDYHETFDNLPGGFGVTGTAMKTMFNAELIYPGVVARPLLASEQAAHIGNYPVAGAGGPPPPPPGGETALDPALGVPMGTVPGLPWGKQEKPILKPEGSGPLNIVGGSSAGMAPHKCEGIVPSDDKCGTNVKGLFAAGDSLCTAGSAYGIGCYSAINSVVQGSVAGVSASDYAKGVKRTVADSSEVAKIKQEMFAPRERKQGFSPRWVTQILQGLVVPYYVLSVKEESRLKAALTNVEFLRDQFANNFLANNIHELRLAHETMNMLLNAEMRLRAGLERKESRGSHFREEYPARDDKNWLAWVIISLKDGQMKLTKRDIPEAWKPAAAIPYKDKYPYSRYIGEKEYLKAKGINI